METTNYTSAQIAPDTWIIHEPINGGIPAIYLLVGDECGILIDSGMGFQNLRNYIKTLTDKPVQSVAVTHGHCDHAGGCGWFETAYLSKNTEEEMRLFFDKIDITGKRDDFAVLYVDEGDVIDLGNREIEVFTLEGHAHGSLAFLDKREKILFTGDNIGNDCKLTGAPGGQLWYKASREQPSVLNFMMDVAKLLTRRDEYERICWGHGHEDEILDASLVEHYMVAALEAMDGAQDEMADSDDPRFPYLYYDYMRTARYKDARMVYDIRYIYATEKGKATHWM